ncbi:MAG: transposase [Deltaproteobacteria bacterium]|nr:transposase [Deltaproteobacteria bacterium]
MSKQKRDRRSYSVDQKAAILRRHLVDKVPVSDLCDEYKIQPSVFYGWQRQLMDNLSAAVEVVGGRKKPSREAELEARIAALEARLAKKDRVIAEISEEYVTLKKELGEP